MKEINFLKSFLPRGHYVTGYNAKNQLCFFFLTPIMILELTIDKVSIFFVSEIFAELLNLIYSQVLSYFVGNPEELW